MALTYNVTTNISATPEAVWGLLTDVASWREWNPTIIEIDGTIALGEKVTLRPQVNPKRTFSPKVTVFDAPYKMVWSDGMPLGLFKGVRTYTISPPDDGSTTFAMEEVYSGLMSGMIVKSIPDMQPAFDEFASSLKTAAEKS